ncbi:MAG: DUF3172 domain-containing protein [Pleurocapsa sp.]
MKSSYQINRSWLLTIITVAATVGMLIGISFSSNATLSPENIASSAFIESAAPDSQLCAQFGASAMVTDTRVFLTLNPFSVYVTQPKMQPGCVLRSSDWAVLEQKHLVSSSQTRECKNSMNTFGYTGKLENSPQIDCIYQNKAAQNLFLTKGDRADAPPEASNF